MQGRQTDAEKHSHRVGQSTRDRWKWLLRLVNHYRRDAGSSWLAGEWDMAAGDLAAFSTGDAAAPGEGAIADMGGGLVEKPTPAEVGTILDRFAEMIAAATEHRRIDLGAIRLTPSLCWLNPPGRYVLLEDPGDDVAWLDRCCYPLARMLREDGHRLRRCPAKLAHDRHACGNVFVHAKRGKFCGASCASREATRAKRVRDVLARG